MTGPLSPDEFRQLELGVFYFKNDQYYQAHDCWEDVWQHMHGRQRLLWQAFIQMAISCYHYENGNDKGALSLAKKSIKKLDDIYNQTSSPPIMSLINILNQLISAINSSQNDLFLSAQHQLKVELENHLHNYLNL